MKQQSKIYNAYLAQKIVLLIIGILLATTAYSQIRQGKKHYAMAISYQPGYVFGTNRFLRGENEAKKEIQFYQQTSIKWGRQADGSSDFDKKYIFPFYGIGLHVGDYNSPKEIGTPLTVFGFCSFPLGRWRKLALIYDLEVGVSFNFKPYSISKNPYNVAMGSFGQGYVGMGFFADFPLGGRWMMDVGIHFAHYSNGAIKRPNLGINSVAPRVILRYNLYDDQIDLTNKEVPKFKSINEWNISFFIGEKEVITETILDSIQRFTTEPFPIYGLATSYHRKVSFKSKFGFGTAISYDGSNNHPDSSKRENLQWSVFPSYELDVGKFTVLIQAGFYVARKQTFFDSKTFYQRVGFKYHFLKNFFAGVNVRAFNFSTADYLEWNLGYRITSSKSS